MKLFYSIAIIIASTLQLTAQEVIIKEMDDFRKHKGFYLSLSGGANVVNISDEVKNEYDLTFKGIGALMDIKIGGAIKENLILHATLTSSTLSGPEIESNGKTEKATNKITIGEGMIGVGCTYYTFINYFATASVGLGNFTMVNSVESYNASTNRGFSGQIKIGKEWWVSKKWGLGVAATYSKTKLTNTTGNIKEYMDSNNFGILFNATLN